MANQSNDGLFGALLDLVVALVTGICSLIVLLCSIIGLLVKGVIAMLPELCEDDVTALPVVEASVVNGCINKVWACPGKTIVRQLSDDRLCRPTGRLAPTFIADIKASLKDMQVDHEAATKISLNISTHGEVGILIATGDKRPSTQKMGKGSVAVAHGRYIVLVGSLEGTLLPKDYLMQRAVVTAQTLPC